MRIGAVACLAAAVLSAAVHIRADDKAQRPALQADRSRYQLRPGDALEITFRFTPEFNQNVTVQPDGYVNLRELPDMYVSGKTIPELSQAVARGYSGILRDPVVSVLLREFEHPYFIAGGELGRPGKYDLRGPTTVLQAVAIAGGFNDRSKHSQVMLFRRISDAWTEVKVINAKRMLKEAEMAEDLRVRAGDMVFVPRNFISKVQRFIPTAGLGMYVNPLP